MMAPLELSELGQTGMLSCMCLILEVLSHDISNIGTLRVVSRGKMVFLSNFVLDIAVFFETYPFVEWWAVYLEIYAVLFVIVP